MCLYNSTSQRLSNYLNVLPVFGWNSSLSRNGRSLCVITTIHKQFLAVDEETKTPIIDGVVAYRAAELLFKVFIVSCITCYFFFLGVLCV